MTTKDIDRLGEEIIRSYGCIPSFLDYNGYPASICVSVNDEVVHGIPSEAQDHQEKAILSAWMQELFTKDITRMQHVHTALERLSKEAQDLIRRDQRVLSSKV